MDRTMINLASLLLGGAGLYAVFTEYSVPELQSTFFGSNPFGMKAEIIRGVMTWIFTIVALSALLLQVFAEIAGDTLPDRKYTITTYAVVFAVGVVLTMALVFCLGGVGKIVARRRWQPMVMDSQREAFMSAKFILEHDGWREAQIAIRDKVADPQRYRKANLADAHNYITQIEKLLQLDSSIQDLSNRTARLAPYFMR